MKVLDIIKVTVVNIQPFGVFVKNENVNGLLHISEIDERFVNDIFDYFSVGDEILVKIIKIDDNKYSFSYKGAMAYPEDLKKTMKIKKGFTPLLNNMTKWIEEIKVDDEI